MAKDPTGIGGDFRPPASGAGPVTRAPGRVRPSGAPGAARAPNRPDGVEPRRITSIPDKAARPRPRRNDDGDFASRFVVADGVRYDLTAPRGTYVNVLI